MKLTKKQAIKECKELWEKIKVSGSYKDKYVDTHMNELKDYKCFCPLCEWVSEGVYGDGQQLNADLVCSDYKRICPLIKQFNKTCYTLGFIEYSKPSAKWLKAIENLKEE